MALKDFKSGIIILFIQIHVHLSSQAQYEINSFCLSGNSINEIQFGPRGDSSYGLFTMSSKDNATYPLGANCTVKLLAPSGYKLHLSFSEISTRSCDNDQIIVTTLSGNQTLCGRKLCLDENCPDLQFDSQTIIVNFKTSKSLTLLDNLKGFVGMITVFSNADKHGNCHTKDQFRCRNRHCIWNGLFCNKHNHCGDNSDEPLKCKPFADQTTIGIIVVLLGIFSFCFFVPLFCYIAIRGQRQKVKIFRSTYQPIPTSINAGNDQVYNAAIIRDENAPSYQFYDSSSSEVTPCHSKNEKPVPYQSV